jgi:hypothetical protein
MVQTSRTLMYMGRTRTMKEDVHASCSCSLPSRSKGPDACLGSVQDGRYVVQRLQLAQCKGLGLSPSAEAAWKRRAIRATQCDLHSRCSRAAFVRDALHLCRSSIPS